jgi:thioredoxin reductase
MREKNTVDVLIVGGGVAGRSAGIFTGRHGLDTVIVTAGHSLLERNAHLENYPGFFGGVNARVFLEIMGEQAERAGCRFESDTVTQVIPEHEGFRIATDSGTMWQASNVVCATKNDVSYLDTIAAVEIIDRGKRFVKCETGGRTNVPGLYVAGRMAEKPHQAIVCAGHGAEVAVAVLEDDDTPFYHDWVVPDGYFTGRDRVVPPGCEEISENERLRRENTSLEKLIEKLEETDRTPPIQQPSVTTTE